MTAAEAAKKTRIRQIEVGQALATINKFQEQKKQETEEERLNKIFKSLDAEISREADRGKSEINHMLNKDFEAIKAHYEPLGFRVSQWEEDAGYCIGYHHYMCISW